MERLRIDKWLWAARFYKTRTLASEEIDKGRVQVNGVAVKPARELKAGDSVQLRSGPISRTVTVTVLALSDKRGPAPVAALLYQETEDSIRQRLQAAEQRRLAPEPALSLSQGRPTKRDRRDTEQLRQHDWDERWSAS
jgi:ribosome-associated heat shock protein Hsp15